MKRNIASRMACVVCCLWACWCACGQQHRTGSAHLTPQHPTHKQAPAFELGPLDDAAYEVTVDKEGYVKGIKYVLTGEPTDTQTGSHADFFIWKKTVSSSTQSNYYYKFEICNTHLEPAESKTRVECFWAPEGGEGGGEGGGGIHGWAEAEAFVRTSGTYWVQADVSPAVAGVGEGIGVQAWVGAGLAANSDWEILSGAAEFEGERYGVASVSVGSEDSGEVVVLGEYCWNRALTDTETLTFVKVVSIAAEPDVVCVGNSNIAYTITTQPSGFEYMVQYTPADVSTPGVKQVLATCGTSAATCTVAVLKVEIAEFDRVAPTKTKQVTVITTPSPLPTGCSISIVCETDAGTTGSATASPTAISQSTTITITGGDQSWGLGNSAAPNNIRLRAKVGSCICDEEVFTVCAHPVNFSTSRLGDLDTEEYVGVIAQNDWESDSGTRSHMNKAQRKEVIGEGPRDNPPFTVGGSMVSGYIPADSPPTLDVHGYPRSSITAGPAGYCIFNQLFKFKCERCGVTDQVCPNSGFAIKHELWNENGTWKHKCTKQGTAVTIFGDSSSAGSGNATSDNHTIP